MSFKTASAILRGKWLLDKQWAHAHMPLVLKLMKGENVEFGFEKDETVEAKKVLSNKATSVYEVGYYTDLSRIPGGSIAMLTLAGPVTKYGDMCSYGSVDHVATLNRLSNSPNIAGIILNIDSPGGEAAGTAMLADAIKAVGKNKPVIALIDDGIAASAAMWIASAAKEIYTTQKTDMVGSVGVYTTIADWYGYFKEQGLQVRDIYAPQSTDKNLDYREALKGNDDLIKEELKVLADEFIGTVATNRAGKLTSNDWATGKMFYSREAEKIGLTDGQKSFDQVVRRMNKLISQQQQSNSNNMAFEKTLSAAGAESFEVVEGGFLLEESHLIAIESAFASHASELQQREAQLQAAADVITHTDAVVKDKEAEAEAANVRIVALEARIAELESADATPGANTQVPEKDNYQSQKTALDNPNSELNKMADALGF